MDFAGNIIISFLYAVLCKNKFWFSTTKSTLRFKKTFQSASAVIWLNHVAQFEKFFQSDVFWCFCNKTDVAAIKPELYCFSHYITPNHRINQMDPITKPTMPRISIIVIVHCLMLCLRI